ncbi:MAG: uracil-DNA glycosylase [Chloroflexi bacterium]|nr:uracil-DNA glycosylase [Chloroflexota bacterium]
MPERERRAVNCLQCRHYQITWDPRTPYGCAALGFKSRQMPSIVVRQSSGLECQAFVAKPSAAKPG